MYDETISVEKPVKTDIASYYIKVLINPEEKAVEVNIYSPERVGFLFKRRELLVSQRFPLRETNVNNYIADLLREHEKPVRLARSFEEWDGYLDLSKVPEKNEPEAGKVTVNKLNIDTDKLLNSLFDNLKKITTKESEPKIYDWRDRY